MRFAGTCKRRVDAAALAAGDKLQQTGSYVGAEQAASSIFGSNLRLVRGALVRAGLWQPRSGAADGDLHVCGRHRAEQVISSLGPQGSRFTITATRPLQLQFARILTSGSTPVIAGSAAGGVNNLLYTPTLARAQPGRMRGGEWYGHHRKRGRHPGRKRAMWCPTGRSRCSGGTANVSGDVYARCQSSIAGVVMKCYPSGSTAPCSYPDVAGAVRSGYKLGDPNYPPPTIANGSQPQPGNNIAHFRRRLTRQSRRLRHAATSWRAAPTGGRALYPTMAGSSATKLVPPDEPNVNNTTQAANLSSGHGRCQMRGRVPVPHHRQRRFGNGHVGSQADLGPHGFPCGNQLPARECSARCQSSLFRPLRPSLEIKQCSRRDSYNIYVSSNGCSTSFGFAYNLRSPRPSRTTAQRLPIWHGNGQNNDTAMQRQQQQQLHARRRGDTVPASSSRHFRCLTLCPTRKRWSVPPDGEQAPWRPVCKQNPNRGVYPAGDRGNENH